MIRTLLISALLLFQTACFDSDEDKPGVEPTADTTTDTIASVKSDQRFGEVKAGNQDRVIEPGRDYSGQKKRRCANFATHAVGAAMTVQGMSAIAANNAEAAAILDDFKADLEQDFPLASLPRLIYEMATIKVAAASGGTEVIDRITKELFNECMAYPTELVLSYGPM